MIYLESRANIVNTKLGLALIVDNKSHTSKLAYIMASVSSLEYNFKLRVHALFLSV